MNSKTRIVWGVLLATAMVAALVPVVALARPEYDDFGSEGGYGGWGWSNVGGGWCHTGDYGVTALSDRPTLNRIAGAVGLTASRLSARLRDGETVAEIAAEKEAKLLKAVDAALSRHRDIVRWRIEDGYITQDQGDELVQLMEEQLRVAFEQGLEQSYGPGSGYNGFGGYGPGPGMGWGHMGGMMGGFGPGRWGW